MGYEQLKNMAEFNREQEIIGREEALNPTVCPWDEWPLSINSRDERSCPICEMVWSGGIWRGRNWRRMVWR